MLRQEWKVVLHKLRVSANPSVRCGVVMVAMLERLDSSQKFLSQSGSSDDVLRLLSKGISVVACNDSARVRYWSRFFRTTP